MHKKTQSEPSSGYSDVVAVCAVIHLCVSGKLLFQGCKRVSNTQVALERAKSSDKASSELIDDANL